MYKHNLEAEDYFHMGRRFHQKYKTLKWDRLLKKNDTGWFVKLSMMQCELE